MTKSFILLSLILLTLNAYSQNNIEQKFKAGIVIGFNATQVDGDDMGGFKKFGLNGGGIVHFMFDKRFSLSTSLLYSQKGAKSSLNTNGIEESRKIILDYVDIPIQFNYHDKDVAIFSGGLLIGRLVRYRQFIGSLPVHDTEENPYSSWALGAIIGATFRIREHFGINMGFQYSVISLGDMFAESNFKNLGQYHNILSLRAIYFIN